MSGQVYDLEARRSGVVEGLFHLVSGQATMLNHNAAVLDEVDTGFSGKLPSGFIDDSALQPDPLSPGFDGLPGNVFTKLRSPKNIDNVERIRDFCQRPVALSTQDGCVVGIYGQNLISLFSHISSDPIAGPRRIITKAHNGNSLGLQQTVDQCFFLRRRWCWQGAGFVGHVGSFTDSFAVGAVGAKIVRFRQRK